MRLRHAKETIPNNPNTMCARTITQVRNNTRKASSRSSTRAENIPKQHPSSYTHFLGSSKAMEARGAVEITQNIHATKKAWVRHLITDDDSSTRANLAHSYEDLQLADPDNYIWPRDPRKRKKKSKGKLPIGVPAPENKLCDPTHRTRIFGGALYGLCNSKEGRKIKMSKADCFKAKQNFGYSQKIHRNKPAPEFKKHMGAVVEHLFHHHEFCDSAWCRFHGMETDSEEYKEAKIRYRCKVKNKELYDAMKKILDTHTEAAMLDQIRHPFDSQKNEALNSSIARVAPKNATFSKTLSLTYRVAWVIVSDSFGYLKSTLQVLRGVEPNVELPAPTLRYLKRRDQKKSTSGRARRSLQPRQSGHRNSSKRCQASGRK